MLFATPDEAEDAFYLAFTNCDLQNMMRVWMDAEHIECIHPGSSRIQGIAAVRNSWQQIFASGAHLDFQISRFQTTQSGNLAIHSVSEQITSRDKSNNLTAEVLSTNIYELSSQGWHMILHHASPAHPMPERSSTMH